MPTLAVPDTELLAQVERSIRVLSKVLYRTPVQRGRGEVRIDRSGQSVLGTLDDLGEVRLSDVAATLQLDVSTVSRQVRVLTDHGLLRRRSDPDDGRASLLELTAAGRRELNRIRAHRVQVLTSATSAWPEEDRRRLLDLLDDLATQAAAQDGPTVSAAGGGPR
jgi:DNA-binding MarR family transcriptional regulator